MDKKDLNEIKKAIVEGHEANHEKIIDRLEARIAEFLDIDLKTPKGRQDCRETWKSAREMKDMKKTFWNRFWFILSGSLTLGLLGIIGLGLKHKIKTWIGE